MMRKVGSEKIVSADFAASHLNLQLLNKVRKSEANSSLATYLCLAMVILWHFGRPLPFGSECMLPTSV